MNDNNEFDSDECAEETSLVEMCPSCGALLNNIAELGDGCNDPLGCGSFKDTEDYDDDDIEEEYDDVYDDEDDYYDDVDELDFDED